MEKDKSPYKVTQVTVNKAENYAYSENEISIVCPSPNGKEIALKLQKELNAELYIKENYEGAEDFKLNDITKVVMKQSKGVIFISSTGVAVRAIAPLLKGKDKDPGVVVVDLSSKYAINILSGHLGGGNELTLKVANILNVQPIITTATDNLGIIAPDVLAKQNDLIIEDLKKAKYISSRLVDGKTVGIKDDYNNIQIGNGYKSIKELEENSIWITHNLIADFKQNRSQKPLDYTKILKLIKRDIVLGIGCRKDTSYEKLHIFVKNSLIEYNLDVRAISVIVSVDVKAKEDGIIKLAKNIDCEFKTFDREKIKTVQDKYEKSEFVLKTLGITGVCEPCVDLAGAEVVISKIKQEGMTLAIGFLRTN